MTKNVRICISGLHVSDEEDSIEQIYSGNYYLKDGKHYIFYEEVSDNDKKIKSSIKINNGVISITKKGIYEYQIIFEELKSNVSYYSTPVGMLEVEIFTNSMKVREEEDTISVHIKYALKIDKVHMSDCEVDIKIYSE
ncbi:MAG: DUF1934 domain-containing protein [Lachnospiraceae bacterium]|nr:DUF1934 domain-containing protein [Lachnospiraceae bacterium]MDE6251383.1 DUF1934 domain-containing protein [Lachnospiraceae bacterium]